MFIHVCFWRLLGTWFLHDCRNDSFIWKFKLSAFIMPPNIQCHKQKKRTGQILTDSLRSKSQCTKNENQERAERRCAWILRLTFQCFTRTGTESRPHENVKNTQGSWAWAWQHCEFLEHQGDIFTSEGNTC